MVLTVEAPAKLNLHLQVLGRRPDGFHELRTLLHSIDLCDELAAEPAPAGQLELAIEPPGLLPEDGDNLVLRAARAVQQHCGIDRGAFLRLHKRIPAGAGLGGGSADAAAALVLLDRLWECRLEPAALHELAADLGSDVPFFLHGGLALGVGRGEEVYPLPDLGELGVIVAMPEIEIPTAEVYHRWAQATDSQQTGSWLERKRSTGPWLERKRSTGLTWSPPDATLYCFSAGLHGEPPWSAMYNDLQRVVVAGWPMVAELLHRLHELQPLLAALTGSGAAVFALLESRQAALVAAEGLRGSDLPCQLHVGSTLPRHRARPVVREQHG